MGSCQSGEDLRAEQQKKALERQRRLPREGFDINISVTGVMQIQGKVLPDDDIAVQAADIVRQQVPGAASFDIVKVHYAGELMKAGTTFQDYDIESEATLNAQIHMLRWSTGNTPSMPKRFGCAAAASVDGHLYVIGGFDGSSAMKS